MFSSLGDLSFKRSAGQAFGFYIAYLVLIFLIGFIFGAAQGLVLGENYDVNLGLRLGNILAIVIILALAFAILVKKKQLGNFAYLLVAISAGILAVFGGGILGLIPVAFLTTRPTHKK